jgi:hypothetical protein
VFNYLVNTYIIPLHAHSAYTARVVNVHQKYVSFFYFIYKRKKPF